MKKTKLRTGKIVLLIVVLIIAAAVFFSLIFWNSSYDVKKYKVSSEVFAKIIKIQKDGGTIKFNSEEVNELISSFEGNQKTSGGITVRGVNADITDNTLKFYIPVTYRKFNFLMTSEGRVYLKNQRIIYDPSYFKVGKVNIPEKYVLGRLSEKLNGKLKVEGNVISMPSNMIPVKVESIGVQNKMLFINAAKGDMSIEQKLKWFRNTLKDTLNSSENTGQDQAGSTGNAGTKSASTASENEKKVISEIISAINSHDETMLVSAQADYERLSPEGKKRVKAAVTSSLDEDTLKEIQEKLN
ncbi:MAG: hypothetical protein LKE46_17405 [Clostridium sp.]|jgi:flagellar basal body-associated protein FliL|uniref:hypothetical protein n=1 Tax=Clostridium sp. TaxID=1506 RepID=UPI0025C31E9A|nr:hypothetical protein [Clostridium sp.]MCH3965992.1 hypothetical protein [Clostridium sp.]MCI1715920.1 hypothetical protein [Clostridium sp.]MCI1800408.1 hypothetical protein [Clostridium sp.]MCI1814097.1 hypothetical protein [Clostridium sp.]MCI1870995.1 hypothetical protein [Clostridium sp.]